MADKIALITGITGQDGSYLAELLLQKGYEVHGIVRRCASHNTSRIDHFLDGLQLHYGDLSDAGSLNRLITAIGPTEVYNLAAQSHVRVSFDVPIATMDIVATGAVRLLEAIRQYQQSSGSLVRYYQASSSEMYGKVAETPQTEFTPFYPRSPYAVGKVAAYWATVNYREAHGLHASNGILFNHESPRRGEEFVTRKITLAAARISHGLQKNLALGNLDAKRDWGFAGDYVEAMWRMVQQDAPGDYVVATGKTHSVREFLEIAFGYVGLDYQQYVVIDPQLYRPTEVDLLLGDPVKAARELKWTPQVSFRELVEMMVSADLKLAAREKTLSELGYDKPVRRAA